MAQRKSPIRYVHRSTVRNSFTDTFGRLVIPTTNDTKAYGAPFEHDASGRMVAPWQELGWSDLRQIGSALGIPKDADETTATYGARLRLALPQECPDGTLSTADTPADPEPLVLGSDPEPLPTDPEPIPTTADPEPIPDPEPSNDGGTMPTTPTTPTADDDKLEAARQALGIGRDQLAAIIAPVVEAKVADGLRNVRPTVIHVAARPEPTTIEGRTHPKFAEILEVLASGDLPYLVGPAGTGKSYIARQLTTALLGADATMVEQTFGPLTQTHAVMGYMDAQGNYVPTPARKAMEHGGLFLADELDRSNSGIGTSLNTVFNARPGDRITFPDGTIEVHPDYLAIGAGNTDMRGADSNYNSASVQDLSLRDRFSFVQFPYDEENERLVAEDMAGTIGVEWCDKMHKVRRNATRNNLDRTVVSIRTILTGCRILPRGKLTERQVFTMRFPNVEEHPQLLEGVHLADVPSATA